MRIHTSGSLRSQGAYKCLPTWRRGSILPFFVSHFFFSGRSVVLGKKSRRGENRQSLPAPGGGWVTFDVPPHFSYKSTKNTIGQFPPPHFCPPPPARKLYSPEQSITLEKRSVSSYVSGGGLLSTCLPGEPKVRQWGGASVAHFGRIEGIEGKGYGMGKDPGNREPGFLVDQKRQCLKI